MKFDLKKEIPLFILAIIPLIYLGSIWNILPEQVPTHYNFEGEADKFSSKTMFAVLIFFMNIFSFGLMVALPFIDPKKQITKMGNKFYKLKFIMVGLVVSLSVFLIYKTIYVETNIQFMMVIMGGFFFALGNYFQTIKQNYFLGIRTPWALNNEDNWKKTHKLGGKVWMIGGLALIAFYFLFSLKNATILNLVVVGIIVVVPTAYSFYLFKKVDSKN